MSSGYAIRVEHLHKRFRIPLDRSSTLKHRVTHPRSSSRFRLLEALRDVSFEVPAGQFIGIIGHNGSGKSTLLKVLARIYQPDAGRVTIGGRVSPFLELGVGFNPELSARENIFLSGAILGLSRADLRRRFDEIIAFAELEQFVDHKLKNFSSGMEVRLAFALAIQAHADILMMDEVLAVGDAAFQKKCFDTFNRYKREGRTVVLVTHELTAVTTYCDRAILLDHGRMAGDGRPVDVTTQYRKAVGLAMDVGQGAADMDRWGTRELMITGVRMMDLSGAEDHDPLTGGSVRIEVDYMVKNESVQEFLAMLGIRRGDDLFVSEVFVPVSRHADLSQSLEGARGTVRYDIPRLPLMGETYRLNVELRERRGATTYDHIENAIHFRVIDSLGRPGVVDPLGEWSLPSPERPDRLVPSAQQ